MPELANHDPQQCSFFFDLPTEIQLLVMSKLDVLQLRNAKLVNKRFHNLANVDQLWRRLTVDTEIDDHAMKEALQICGSLWTWQQLFRTVTLIERENRKAMQGSITQMAQKIQQVREALDRQTRVLEETHGRLEMLSSRLNQMEQHSRAREVERIRTRRRETQQVEDKWWVREWDRIHMEEKEHDIGLEQNLEQELGGGQQ
ncbi:hypothetical protein BC939DRAFT_460162 [Gamsiella multidivaricata]|uniref:uncharacterized protein n=1 Tax=Gamsiella multidivaricata TaxID=101098 RepID=UPI002220D3C6|nr:uncharacterized protein BC939DRAFT_460162 [Gamsiella multidivaricata]KAI7819407.1 hypothetical protein BC939DRAFT_460162 [Gamsiella multidivaricata]